MIVESRFKDYKDHIYEVNHLDKQMVRKLFFNKLMANKHVKLQNYFTFYL